MITLLMPLWCVPPHPYAILVFEIDLLLGHPFAITAPTWRGNWE